MKMAVVVSHPIQYYSPIFRELAAYVELTVFYAQDISPEKLSDDGFGTRYLWDVDLLSGYEYKFLKNVAIKPSLSKFFGSDTPGIWKELDQGGFDVVLVFGWYLKSLMQAITACVLQRRPLLVRGDSQLKTTRGAIKRVAKSALFPLFLRVFDGVLYVGRASRDYYEHYGYPGSRLFFSPHCVDTDWFRTRATVEERIGLRESLGIPIDDKVVLFAGKLVDFKRPLDVIDAVSRLTLPQSVHVMVAGSGPLESAIRARAVTLGTQLHMLGFQNQSQMPCAYAAADVLVLPSNGRETWGLVAKEALSCGVPIVVSNEAGCSEDLAGDRASGEIFDAGDITGLSRALARVLENPPTREFILARAAQYSIPRAVRGIVDAAEFACRR